MDRRAFVSGLVGVAGVAAFAGAMTHSAFAAPISRPVELMPDTPDDLPGEMPADHTASHAPAARTPDGTPVEPAQYVVRRRRRWHRRRRRMVCRTRVIRGRLVRTCRSFW